MNKISAIIITKNSEKLIADCMDSVSFCDEIIVIDDNSTDKTSDLATHFGAKVYQFASKSFSEKRNFGLKKAKNKWIIYIDDDERISSELKKNILKIVSLPKTEFYSYKLQRKNFYLGKNEWPVIEKMERLFRKNELEKWVGDLHETPVFKGTAGELDGYLFHYTHQNLKRMVEKTIEWSGIEADLRFRNNHPQMTWWRFFRVMITGFYGSYIQQKGYKVGVAGLIESLYQSFSMFMTYARLWELQNKLVNSEQKVILESE